MEELIKENEKLIWFVINKYFPSYFNDKDIYSLGLIALWKSCCRYDKDKGKLLPTFTSAFLTTEIASINSPPIAL